MRPRNRFDREDDTLAKDVIWPLVAENLWIVDRALGIVVDPEFPETMSGGMRMLETLPQLPAKYGLPLLSIAMS